MKYIDKKQLENLEDKRLADGETFRFRCHPEVSCFNRCCRNLNLFLYPYDIIRLKNCLAVSSDRFLDRYVDIVLRPGNYFPEVLLTMSDNHQKTCPFLTDAGCGVYADRPDACRTFPIEQGVQYDSATRQHELVHFYRPPDFCMGQHERKIWTVQSWEADQQAVIYHKMTLKWSLLKQMFTSDPWGEPGIKGPMGKMAFMATYNPDRFRDFIFNSSFLKRYRVKAAVLNKIKRNDVELMRFGFAWVKLFIWNMSSKFIGRR
jgi:Fe-S-cluster containining protein